MHLCEPFAHLLVDGSRNQHMNRSILLIHLMYNFEVDIVSCFISVVFEAVRFCCTAPQRTGNNGKPHQSVTLHHLFDSDSVGIIFNNE